MQDGGSNAADCGKNANGNRKVNHKGNDLLLKSRYVVYNG